MNKKQWKNTSNLIIISFIGAAMAIFLDRLILNYKNFGAWLGFTLGIIILFLIANYMLTSIEKQYKK